MSTYGAICVAGIFWSMTACGGGEASPDAPRPDPCVNGAPGLHVTVDLTADPDCRNIVSQGISVGLEGRTLLPNDAEPATHLGDYRFAWPAGTPDGWEGMIEWTGAAEIGGMGRASTIFQVHLAVCVTVALVASCSAPGASTM